MNPLALLLTLKAAGLVATTNGATVKLVGPVAALTPDVLASVAKNKVALIAALTEPAVLGVPHDPHDPQPQQTSDSVWAQVSADSGSGKGSNGGTCGTSGTAEAEGAVPIAVDFETRSLASLTNVGGRNYAADGTTETLCACFILPDGTMLDWVPPAPLDERVRTLIAAGTPVMAHNAHGFDRFVWQKLGWPSPDWIDTIALARVLGLPASLEELGESLLGASKDVEGRAFVLSLGRPNRTGHLPLVARTDLERVLKYCRLDVLILRGIFEKRLHLALSIEPNVRDLDVVVNECGFPFDADLARAVISCEELAAHEARTGAGVEPATLASPKKLKGVLAEAGFVLPDVRRDRLLGLLDSNELPDDVERIVIARLASSGINGHKLRAGLRRVGADGRLRDTLGYAGAHTGRWVGRGFQPQNLPRGVKKLSREQLADAIGAARSRDVRHLGLIAESLKAPLHELLASLVRACIVAPEGRVLGVVDYGSIEARALLWLAGDADGLGRFANDAWDPYKAMASRLFAIEEASVNEEQRSLGKALILGCGYAMGSRRFELYAETYGVDWSGLPITPQRAVDAWRDAHPLVAGERTEFGRTGGLWKVTEQLAIDTVGPGTANALGWGAWTRDGQDLVCVLPSQRPLYYHRPRLERVTTPWGKEQWVLTYEHRGQRVRTYGGKLVENITQAMCRDLLADAMLRLDEAGITTLLHVHDEVVSDLDDATELETMKNIMSTPPNWAPDLPLKVVGYADTRYRK